jgi:gluconolactonase
MTSPHEDPNQSFDAKAAVPAERPSPHWAIPNSRYPDPRVEVLDKRFRYRLGNAAIERVATGFRWAEGPVYFRDGRYFLWSDLPNNRIMRWLEDDGRVSVFRADANFANGNTRDLSGRLITCEHGSRSVTRTEFDGTITVLADRYKGKRLNSPNDVIVKSDGSIWFTDPSYGIDTDYEGFRAIQELPCNVYRLDPNSGECTVVADDFVRPNGLAFSPDESRLYIVESGITHGGPAHVRVFDVVGDRLSRSRIFAEDFAPSSGDGLRVDVDGNVWCAIAHGEASEDGVRCFSPSGDLIGKIHLPEGAANLCFGGVRRNRLFMTASTSVYALYVSAIGAQRP